MKIAAQNLFNSTPMMLAIVLTSMLGFSANAQVTPPEVEQSSPETIPVPQTMDAPTDIELLPERVVARGSDLRGVRIARPGALLFASFDDDHSLTISMAEIQKNSIAAFKRADTDSSGSLSIFEQQDWAEAVGSHDGPLANAVTFDTNIDRQITQKEFDAGLERLAKSYMGPEGTEIEFASLLINPNGKKPQKPERNDKEENLTQNTQSHSAK